MKEWDLPSEVTLQDIKFEQIKEDQLDMMKSMTGSFEAIFSKRSRNFRKLNLHERSLSESELKELIQSDYTFLKRPVLIWNDKIFVGNAKNNVAQAKEAIDLER